MTFEWNVELKDTYVRGTGATPSQALAKLEENLAAQIERDRVRVDEAQKGLRHLENVRTELGLPLRTEARQ